LAGYNVTAAAGLGLFAKSSKVNMSRFDINPEPSLAAQAARVSAFLLALTLGLFLGWRLFIAPRPEATPTPSNFPTQGQTGIPTATIPVAPTGEAAIQLGQSVRVGQPAPDFMLDDLHHQTQRLSDYRGSVVLLNFWATWCPPCRIEMPTLQAVYDKLASQGLVVLGLNWTQVDDAQQVQPYSEGLGITFPILLDPDGHVADSIYPIQGLPTSVIIDRDGVVQQISVGPLPADKLEKQLQALLGPAP
jgi:cytochrome c biogenesis protein CcmG/thiol:disulfide interchange protein DsbE